MLNLNLENKSKNPKFVRMEDSTRLGKNNPLNLEELAKTIAFIFKFGIKIWYKVMILLEKEALLLQKSEWAQMVMN